MSVSHYLNKKKYVHFFLPTERQVHSNIPNSRNRMNSSDTLREILLRSQNPRVFPLLSSEMEELSSVILTDNKFWHERLEYYLRRDLPWNPSEKYEPTYWSLIDAANEKVPEERYKHAHTLPALLLLEEEYGPPSFSDPYLRRRRRDFLLSITDPKLLDYILSPSNKYSYGEYGLESIAASDLLDKMIREANMPMISALASHLGRSSNLLRQFIELAMKAKISEEVRMNILLALRPLADLKQASTYVAILSTLNSRLWDTYRDEFISRNQINSVVSDLSGYLVNVPALKFLLFEEPEASKKIDWKNALNYALNGSDHPARPELAKLFISHVHVNTKANQILMRAASSSSAIFEAVLSDERIDPMVNSEGILLAILNRCPDGMAPKKVVALRKENRRAMWEPTFTFRYQDQETRMEMRDTRTGYMTSNYEDVVRSLLILCRDPRFRFDELTVQEVRLLGYGLYSRVVDRISDEKLVVALLEGEVTASSLLLRYILFADPTAEQLAQFMLDQGENDIYLAAHSVMGKYVPENEQVNIIRALLLQMLYPSMTVEENMIALRQEGASKETIDLCRTLCVALRRT